MRQACRRLTVLVALLSLLGGSWLPADTNGFADNDGICGPTLAVDQPVTSVSQDQTSADHPPQHCMFCHWRHTMASASAAVAASIGAPIYVGQIFAVPTPVDPAVVASSAATPRGPPAIA
jgi:hypothetical protein